MVTVVTMILISMSGVPWVSVLLRVMLTLRIMLAMMLRLSWISSARVALMTMLWREMILVQRWLSGISLIRWSGRVSWTRLWRITAILWWRCSICRSRWRC